MSDGPMTTADWLRAYAAWIGTGQTDMLDGSVVDTLLNAADEIERLRAKAERLQQEAEGHAQEARTQTATVHEIYQIISGGKGEPGSWHGAEPVREFAERLCKERDMAQDIAEERHQANLDCVNENIRLREEVKRQNDETIEELNETLDDAGAPDGDSPHDRIMALAEKVRAIPMLVRSRDRWRAACKEKNAEVKTARNAGLEEAALHIEGVDPELAGFIRELQK